MEKKNCQNSETGQIFTKNNFSPQKKPYRAKPSFSGVSKHFSRKLQNKFLFNVKKVTIQKEAKNYSESNFFLNKFEKGKFLRKDFDLMETNFLFKPVKPGKILPKTVLLLKMSHIQVN